MGEHADDALGVCVETSVGNFRAPRSASYDPRLAAMRIQAHNAFDPIWKSCEMTRSEAYTWLAKELGINPNQCHMQRMSISRCAKVIDICTRRAFADLIKK